MARRLAGGRREELLDGVIRIIAARGFYDTSTSDIARELKCSVSTLYKIAPSKDGLVLLAFDRWADVTFPGLEARAEKAESASGRARAYFRAGAESVHPFSVAFFADLLRFESIGLAWRTKIADRYIDRFVDLVGDAVEAGEVRPVNSTFPWRDVEAARRCRARRAHTDGERTERRGCRTCDRLDHLGRDSDPSGR